MGPCFLSPQAAKGEKTRFEYHYVDIVYAEISVQLNI